MRTATLERKLDRPRYHVLVLAAGRAGGAYQLTIARAGGRVAQPSFFSSSGTIWKRSPTRP